MAQTNRGSAQESVSAQLRDLSTGPPIPFDQAAGSVSDNDASEKPVREKLKKTSLASIAKDAVKAQGRKIGDAEEKTCASDPVRREASPERGSCGTAVGSRGRPMRKRSFDDLETPEAEDKSTGAGQDHVKELDGHARKRSRDVRVGDTVKEDARHLTAGSFLEEESEEAASSSNPHELIENEFEGAWGRDEREKLGPPKAGLNADALCIGTNQSVSYTSGTLAQVTAPEPDKNPVDHEMRDSTASPRKKRSRDQLDTEADREQKIHATEEARAHRRSDELERAEGVPSSDQSVVPSGVSFPIEKSRFTAEEKVVPEKADNQEEARDEHSSSITIDEPTLTSSGATIGSDPPKKSSTAASKAVDHESQVPAAAFASTGFAALSGSSASPFGALSASSTAAVAPSPFASTATSGAQSTEVEGDGAKEVEVATNGGFSVFAKASTSGFGNVGSSSLGAHGTSQTGVFGGSLFGNAFGAGLGGGGRLTSFAAPTGDTKFGPSNGAVKPIGSPIRNLEGDDNSESDGERLRDEETEEPNGRFQRQDVETGEAGEVSVFISRASLYSFKESAWKESGKGTFKLNIAASPTDDPSSSQRAGRFIMRAHQTYRVLLNVPVYKQMKVGDGKGEEPSGKSFAFAAIEKDGKLCPYMIKLGDVDESKTLYHEVRKLQKDLE